MYFNDVHILIYVLLGIIGIFVGTIVNTINDRLQEEKKILCKETFKEYKIKARKNKWVLILIPILYIALLYRFGIGNEIANQLNLLKYLILIPMLISVFIIDYKEQIIPNRLNLTMFEIGLIFTFVFGMINLNLAKDMLLGMVIGAGSFLIITLLGGLIAGKEAMGFGDVKLMGALGLYFGALNIGMIALMAFLIGAVLSILLLVTKVKKTSDYIPFGPFIVIATFIMIFIPSSIVLDTLITVFTLGLNKR